MFVTEPEARFVRYTKGLLRGVFAERSPRGFQGLGPAALELFEQGLAKVALRFLLEHGGVAKRTAVIRGERRNHARFWDDVQEPLQLSFGSSLYELFKHLFQTGSLAKLPTSCRGPFTVADNVVLLMLAHGQSDMTTVSLARANELVTLGYLPALFYFWKWTPAKGPRLPDDPSLGHVLFALRPLLTQCWKESEAGLRQPVRNGAERLLEAAEGRGLVWQALADFVERCERRELLASMCDLEASTFTDAGQADTLLDNLNQAGGYRYDSERQPAFRRLLTGYNWLEEIHRLRARRVSRYDDDYDSIRVFHSYATEVPEAARQRGRELISRLRFEL